MPENPLKNAITFCKTIMRNGYDAHIVNTPYQAFVLSEIGMKEIDLCTDMSSAELAKNFASFSVVSENTSGLLGTLQEEDFLYRFYQMPEDNLSPENTLMRTTPTLLESYKKLLKRIDNKNKNSKNKKYVGFLNMENIICFSGDPEETIKQNYLIVVEAMRHAANFDLPIEKNSWMAIVRSAQKVIDYLSPQQIMDEWRLVTAESMWRFTQLLFESQLLHSLIPEIAALSRTQQTKNDTGVEETVLHHTIEGMRHYPATELHYDWIGTFAMLFHDVGKLYTAEFYDGRWTFYQHHKVGAKIARIILRRLRVPADEIELICELVRNHMRFQFMMTDKGIRIFKELDIHKRLIAMSKANIMARDDNYTAFNHNNKYLTRAETPSQMLEPLLNGNQIMEATGLEPGPHVGELRQNLLKAQIAGKVTTNEEAMAFVKEHTKRI